MDPQNLPATVAAAPAAAAAAPAAAAAGAAAAAAPSAAVKAPPTAEATRTAVSEYYSALSAGQGASDLQCGACCCNGGEISAQTKAILKKLHPEITARMYGCGSPIPEAIEGRVVLDLGSGTGTDVYVCSALVGEKGRVIGVDMTDQQLEIARRYQDFHAQAFGMAASNVEFRKGVIEDLRSAHIEDNSVDVVISNCVVNLSADKRAVFREIARVLKPGGELLFSDVFADRRVDPALQADKTLWGECLSGAMYFEDFRRLIEGAGFGQFYVKAGRKLTVDNPAIAAKVGYIRFYSLTIRCFKCPDMEDRPEDYGQLAIYKGGIGDASDIYDFDMEHCFPQGEPCAVDGNVGAVLAASRLSAFFQITPRTRHCGPMGGMLWSLPVAMLREEAAARASEGCGGGGCGCGGGGCGGGGVGGCGCGGGGCGCGGGGCGCGGASASAGDTRGTVTGDGVFGGAGGCACGAERPCTAGNGEWGTCACGGKDTTVRLPPP